MVLHYSFFEALLVGLPALLIASSVALGARQARSLRDLTGDSSLLTSLLGLTTRPPSEPNPEHLKVHPSIFHAGPSLSTLVRRKQRYKPNPSPRTKNYRSSEVARRSPHSRGHIELANADSEMPAGSHPAGER